MRKDILFLIFVLVFMSSFPVWAQQSRTGCEIARHIRHIQLKNNKLTRTDTVELLILDRRGENYTNISLPYTKSDRLNILYARIEDMSGKVLRSLKKSEIKDKHYISDISLYEDDYIKYFSLKSNNYPYKVTYAYTYSYGQFLSIGGINQSGKLPVRNGKLILEIPAETQFEYLQENMGDPAISKSDEVHTYVWDYDYKYTEPQVNGSADSFNTPHLMIVPKNFVYGKQGSFASWSDLGSWISELKAGLDILPQSEKTAIDRLIQGVNDKQEKVRILYEYLQDYNRYINVKIDIGGLRAYPVEYVCRNRYGDCKALSNYMTAVLTYAGIDAYYTLVELSDEIPRFYVDFPHQAFNHVITVVPMATDTLYLECTSKNTPYNFIPSSVQGRKALLTDATNSRLIDIPAWRTEDIRSSYTYDVILDGYDARVSLDAKLRGHDFERYGQLSAGANKNDLDMYMRNSLLGGSYVLTSYSLDRESRSEASINLKATAEIKGAARKVGNYLTLTNFAFSIPNYETPDKRTAAVQIDRPASEEITITYTLSPVMKIAKVPETRNIETPHGHYRVRYSVDSNTLTVHKELVVNAGRYPFAEYDEFYKFIDSIRSSETNKINISLL